MPPPGQWGARVLPWRARPVPFCRHGLATAAGHLAARLGLVRSQPGIGLLPQQGLVHQRLVDRHGKDVVTQLRFVYLITLYVVHRHTHLPSLLLKLVSQWLWLSGCIYFLTFFISRVLRAWRIMSRPFSAPGTAPRTANRFRSGSTMTTFRVWTVT